MSAFGQYSRGWFQRSKTILPPSANLVQNKKLSTAPWGVVFRGGNWYAPKGWAFGEDPVNRLYWLRRDDGYGYLKAIGAEGWRWV